jgi:hypothetical protein
VYNVAARLYAESAGGKGKGKKRGAKQLLFSDVLQLSKQH